MTKANYQGFVQQLQKVFDVQASIALLNWDQETYMPKGGAAQRSRQISTLSAYAHELFTDPAFKSSVRTLNDNLDSLNTSERVNIKETYKQIARAEKLDAAFVSKRSECISATYQSWIKARAEKNYSIYEQQLQQLIELKKEEADRIGYTGHPYNALLEEFEPGMDCKQLDRIFQGVKDHLNPLLKQILAKSAPDDRFMRRNFDKDKQWDFGIDLLKGMGYDFDRGRQDLSIHPFTTGFGADDIRVTTRVNEHNLASMVWSCIHEGGHALYEQGLPSSDYGLPTGKYISLGIHESQSRLWENHVGRSSAYWNHNFKLAQSYFPEQLHDVGAHDFYAACNKIEASPIRTEADELTYHFHVMIRYEIEKELITGNLSTKDAEAYWNEAYKTYLGLNISDPNQGILQDIHWSLGSLGYFPTYSIGSFYAAQFYAAAGQAIEDLELQITEGDTSQLLSWLQQRIYEQGMHHSAEELAIAVTGEPLNYDYFKAYTAKKYGALYDL